MTVVLRDGSEVDDPRLDAIYEPDPRDLGYQAAATTDLGGWPRSKTWKVRAQLNQGREGACVGFAWSHLASSTGKPPNMSKWAASHLTDQWARERIYYPAQKQDAYPGGQYPGADPQMSGTGLRDGAKIAQRLGIVESYLWVHGLFDLARALATHGPLVVASKWYRSMHGPDAEGRVVPGGDWGGRHAYLVYRQQIELRGGAGSPVDWQASRWWIWNSWGAAWGDDGTCWVDGAGMDLLLSEQGEAILPARRTMSNAELRALGLLPA